MGEEPVGPQELSPRESAITSQFRVVVLALVVVVAVAAVGGYLLVYNQQYRNGYTSGYYNGLDNGRAEMFIQAGTTLLLPPGGELDMPFMAGSIGNFSIWGQADFSVGCGLPFCTRSTGTAMLFIEHGGHTIFNSSYVASRFTRSFSFQVNTGDNYATWIILRANPTNNGTVAVDLNSPLSATINSPVS